MVNSDPEVLKLIEAEKETITNLNEVTRVDKTRIGFRDMFMETKGFAKTTCGRLIDFINRVIERIDKNPDFAASYKDRIVARVRDTYHDTDLAENISNVYFLSHRGSLEEIKAEIEKWGAQGGNLDYYIRAVQNLAQRIRRYFGEKAYEILLKRGIIKHLHRYYDEFRYLERLQRMIETGEQQGDWEEFMKFHGRIKTEIRYVRDYYGDERLAEEMKAWENKYKESLEDWKREMKGAVITIRGNLQNTEYVNRVIVEAQKEFLEAIEQIGKLISRKGGNATKKFRRALVRRKKHWRIRLYFERERFKQYEKFFLYPLIKGEREVRGLNTDIAEGVNSNAERIKMLMPLIEGRGDWLKWLAEASDRAADKRTPQHVFDQIEDGMGQAQIAIAKIAERARPILKEIERNDDEVERDNTNIIKHGRRISKSASKEAREISRVMKEISAEFGIDLGRIVSEVEEELKTEKPGERTLAD